MSEETRANDQLSGPSWDLESTGAPQRPAFASSLAEEPIIKRPSRVVVSFVLVLLAVFSYCVVTFVAVLHFEETRDALVTALPEDLQDEYSKSDIRRAVHVLLGVTGGLGLILTLGQILSSRSLLTQRSATARAVLVVMTVLYLPVAFVMAILRDGTMFDLVLSGVAAVFLLVAVFLVCSPAVSTWLRQSDPRRSIPLVPEATAGNG